MAKKKKPKKEAAAADASSDKAGEVCEECLSAIVAYDIEGHYIGTKPPLADEAYLSTKALVDANRASEKKVDREAIINDTATTKYLCTHHDLLLLAGISYGEASTKNVYEEMAAIANVLVRQMKARGQTTMRGLIGANKNFAYAASDGNARFKAFQARVLTAVDMREGNDPMRLAIKGAINAILEKHDYSNGAYFWDGKDLGTNYDNHEKIQKGMKFSDDSHRIFTVDGAPIADHSNPTTTYWYDKNGKPTKERGSYDYTYETTAAWGDTVFSKITDDYVKATGGKPYQ